MNAEKRLAKARRHGCALEKGFPGRIGVDVGPTTAREEASAPMDAKKWLAKARLRRCALEKRNCGQPRWRGAGFAGSSRPWPPAPVKLPNCGTCLRKLPQRIEPN